MIIYDYQIALETAFFVHKNCCWLFQSTFPNSFLSQTWNLLLPPSRCKQFCRYDFTLGVSAVQSVGIDHRQSS